MGAVEILCTACGNDAWLVRKPRYEGLKKVGETLSCSVCGYEFASEEVVPYKEAKKPQVFSDTDRSPTVEVFKNGENSRLCRYCEHYVINPFLQWCTKRKKEVEATDSCPDFTKKKS